MRGPTRVREAAPQAKSSNTLSRVMRARLRADTAARRPPPSLRRASSGLRGSVARKAQTRAARTATDAVETGTRCFKEGRLDEALRLYEAAMELAPNSDEARAAQYNAACVHAKQRNWAQAVQCLSVAVNEYGLKRSVIFQVRKCSGELQHAMSPPCCTPQALEQGLHARPAADARPATLYT